MSALSTLQDARARLLSGWTQFVFARDVEGEPCASRSAKARRWCLQGAIWDDSRDDLNASYVVQMLCRGSSRAKMTVDYWNDRPERTKEEVIALIDRAIQIVKEYQIDVTTSGQVILKRKQ